jgi:endogenous inhibitor of DNA gyrase (YacG/DUF329 family)
MGKGIAKCPKCDKDRSTWYIRDAHDPYTYSGFDECPHCGAAATDNKG